MSHEDDVAVQNTLHVLGWGYSKGPGRVMRCLFGGTLAGRASRGLGYRRHVPRSGVQSACRDVLGFSRSISARA